MVVVQANEEVLNDNSTDDELEATETFLSDQVPEADAAVGDEIVLRSSDVSEEDLEDWVKQGYSVMERTEGNIKFVKLAEIHKISTISKCPSGNLDLYQS